MMQLTDYGVPLIHSTLTSDIFGCSFDEDLSRDFFKSLDADPTDYSTFSDTGIY